MKLGSNDTAPVTVTNKSLKFKTCKKRFTNTEGSRRRNKIGGVGEGGEVGGGESQNVLVLSRFFGGSALRFSALARN